ncbi:MAG TPA: thioredoxin domain-containing protein [Candidatus Binatia bacterium]|nr:thioredoxin domain-containing protein [Candidatus Binatia bacterium]
MTTLWILLSLLGLGLPAAAQAAGDALAEVDGVAITSEEVEKSLAGQLSKLEEQIYSLKRQRVEALINEKLLQKEAVRRNLSIPALLDAEVTAKVGLVTEQEIEKFYRDNKAQIKGDEAQVREQIRSYLQNQKIQTRREAFLQSLRSQAKVVVNLKPPPVLRVYIKSDGAPSKGKANAPVTIVEFSDFHCPFCKGVLPTLTQLESRYGDKVRIVFRDFPIDSLHPAARKGHEAARCANEQGKFWPYHDKLFANAPKASPEDLKTYAKDVGLDVDAFEQCFNSGKYQAAVQQDIDAGIRAGVTGTPAFFINGRMISGAQPLDTFARLIEEELARVAPLPREENKQRESLVH